MSHDYYAHPGFPLPIETQPAEGWAEHERMEISAYKYQRKLFCFEQDCKLHALVVVDVYVDELFFAETEET